jgi:Lrp/AsnC family transcriptional regulator for asnA, asnC and gidA
MHNIMVKVDLKDRQILYELDFNSRQSLTKLGKKVGLHKNVVAYRIKKLQQQGVIHNFYTVIDSFKLGYNSLRFYIVYQNVTPDIREEIINYFVNNKYTWWVGSFEGGYDLAVVMWVRDLRDFFVFWEETLKKYHQYFQQQKFSNYVQLRLFRHSYLVRDSYRITDREKYEITGGGRQVDTDALDFKILELLAKDARIPTVEIAERLNSTVDTVKNRIRRLMKLDVIQAFRVNYDHSKLGYHLFKVNIDLNNYNQRGRMINYIRYNPHLTMIDKSIGYHDLELDFHLKDIAHLHEIMDDFAMKFPNDIKGYTYAHDPLRHKMIYIPEE